MKLILALVLLVVPTAANAKTITLTVHSSPEGAMVAGFGQTPVAITYKISGCQNTLPLTVQWTSGVTTMTTLTLCEVIGKQQVYTVQRPEGDGLAIDVQVAFQRALLLQMSAQRTDWPAPVMPPPVVIRQPTSCVAIPIGRRAYVSCT
jgi:hypothetical protein